MLGFLQVLCIIALVFFIGSIIFGFIFKGRGGR